MSSIDALHALTLNNDNVESSVTVNQRALIDKVLSRYSSENTLLRELLQNSDDANATSVKIIYESSARQPVGNTADDIHRRVAKRVIVKNNGQVFRPEDWSRLSRIAEGNPDEAKIGAFGVGFYSVFSICEDPFVTSGSTGLAFYWRNDQLFTRTANLPSQDDWTTFALNMRQESELPNLKNLTKFLATSLTFSRSLSHIELWLDDRNLCNIKRVASTDSSVAIPTSLTRTTAGKMLRITEVTSSSVQISATYLDITQTGSSQAPIQSKFFSFFAGGRQEPLVVDPSAKTTSQIFLRVLTGAITSSVNPTFSKELQRATKKPPPKHTKIQLVTINAAEYAASTHTAPIFENLLTFPNQGRVYIGFPTHQTTGFAGHVGAPCIIPTVERESIDLVDRFIKVWNFEVLRAVGILTRIAYHVEYSNVRSVEDAIHTLKFFSMSIATPQSINQTIEETFFEASTVLPISSTLGTRSSTTVRLPNDQIRFLQTTPMLLDELTVQVPRFIDRLRRLGYIEPVSIGDIKADLQDRVLSITEATSFLKYCAALSRDIDRPALQSLLRAGVVDVGNNGPPLNLGSVTSYAVAKNFPDSVPVPDSCVVPAISSALLLSELHALGWNELSVLSWLEYIVDSSRTTSKDISTDADFAALVLSIISKNFDALTTEQRSRAIAILQERPCVPTKSHGILNPGQTYFHTIKLFDDLPLVLTMKGVKERFLAALGVRKTIELNIIFDRLVTGGQWTSYDLISYLTSVRKDIPARDMDRLRMTPLANSEGTTSRMLISNLYEPNDTLRSLTLPVLSWPKDRWKSQSPECDFVYALGLKRFPPVDELLRLASTSTDPTIRNRALAYFVLNFVLHDYGASYDSKTTTVSFIPTESGKLERPSNLFSNPSCETFNLEVLRKDLVARASTLGVQPQPPVERLLQSIISQPPKSHSKATAQFAFVARLQPVFSKTDIENISRLEIIPVEKNGKLIKMVQARKCFFKQESSQSIYGQIFDCVDFGFPANNFLRSIGVRDEPSTSQIAGMLVNDASNVLSVCGSEDRYSSLLTQVAKDSANVKKDRHLWEAMKRTRCLLAHKYIARSANAKTDAVPSSSEDGDEELTTIETSLQKAGDVVIVDDVIDFNMFRADIYSCPQEQYLEDLYRELGSPRISSIVLDRPITNGKFVTNETTETLKIEILERLTVFLSESNTKTKRDVRDLTKNLSVGMQEQIAIQREIRFSTVLKQRHLKVTALTLTEGRRLTLVVSRSPDKYDISVALCKVVLTSAKIGDFLLLETLMTNSLRTLKLRGYNVDRILQRQERDKMERQLKLENEEQAAMALEEQRRKAQAILKEEPENERALTPKTPVQTDAQSPPPSSPQLSMPGTFPDPPKGSGFLTNLKKGLGLSRSPTNRRASGEQRAELGSTSPQKPQYPDVDQQMREASRVGQAIKSNSRPTQGVTSQASINRALQNAISLTRDADNHSIFSPAVIDQVTEARSFCDAKPAHDLVLATTLPNNTKFFINRHLDRAEVLATHTQLATQFSHILQNLGDVFRVNPGSINIFYDSTGPTIAFNKTGTIYCNLHFYHQLHHRGASAVGTLPSQTSGTPASAYTYWYVTVAHELAHNLVSEHSSEHEFYMESMIVEYLPRLVPLFSGVADVGLPRYQM